MVVMRTSLSGFTLHGVRPVVNEDFETTDGRSFVYIRMGSFLAKTNKQTRKQNRANAQTIYNYLLYKQDSSYSSPLHNQSSPTFESLHATLQQNDTLYAFHNPVTLREHQGHSNWNKTVEIINV